MSLSTRSKTKIAIAITVGSNIAAEAAMIMGMPKLLDESLLGVGVLAAIAGFLLLSKANKEFTRTIEVCERIDDGDFEARIIGIKEGGNLGKMQNTINSMMDRCDAYVRESMACQEYVANNK